MHSILNISFALLLMFVAHSAEAENYTAKKGDTYAKIARRVYGEPVFGPHGTIEKIYRLNPATRKNSTLEPGQVVVLESKPGAKRSTEVAKPTEETPETRPEPAAPVETAPETPSEMTMEMKHAAPKAEVVFRDDVPTTKCQEPLPCPACTPIVSLTPAVRGSSFGLSIVPTYSIFKHSATDTASGSSYSLQSSQAYGADFAWDHRWNDSFSTVFSYSVMQVSSNEKSDATGANVIDNVSLNRGSITLFNQLATSFRVGFGAAYGDHLFLEQLTSVPNDPKIYKADFLHAYLAAEFAAFETKSLDVLLGLKVAALPAQNGQGHDLSKGTEFAASLSIVQKFETWGVLFGLSYSSSNQARTNATETRTEGSARLGIVF